MRGRKPLKAAGLVVSSALLILAVTLVGLFAFIYYNTSAGLGWSAPHGGTSRTPSPRQRGATASPERPCWERDRWAMLLDGDGRGGLVPPEAGRCARGLFPSPMWPPSPGGISGTIRSSVGSGRTACWWWVPPRAASGSMISPCIWRPCSSSPSGSRGFFLLALICVLGLAALVLRRWFRREQQARDAARSGWINGISHDIRTPLSVVMGYAAQMAADPGLPAERRRQAAILCRQSQAIRDLVNDLNLTMRLDCEMQVLRRERLQPAAFLRQTAADFLNSGLAEGFPLEVELPEASLPALEVDAFLLRRAVNNLLSNCVRHNPPGCPIRVGARAQGDQVILWVESAAAAGLPGQAAPEPPLEGDGGAAHGTGLKQVAQIAAAHGGEARFSGGTVFRCELWLPAGGGS